MELNEHQPSVSLPVEHQELVFYVRYVPSPISGYLEKMQRIEFHQPMVTYQELKVRAQDEFGIEDIDSFELCYEHEKPLSHSFYQRGSEDMREPLIHMYVVHENAEIDNLRNKIARMQNTRWLHIGPHGPRSGRPLPLLNRLVDALQRDYPPNPLVKIDKKDTFTIPFVVISTIMFAFWISVYYYSTDPFDVLYGKSIMYTIFPLISFFIGPYLKQRAQLTLRL